MATLLHRLGRFAYRRRVLVLSIWVAVLVLLGVGAATLRQPMASTISIPGTESQRAIDLLKQRMPQAAVGDASARIVFSTHGRGKVTDPAHERPWGIYSGYFRDLDGHLWEVIWNPRAG